MTALIRKGTINDASAIFSLINELATFEKEPEAVEITIEDIQKDGFGEAPQFKVFVAELDNFVVGMALFYHRYSTWKGKTIHLEDLIVKQSYRGRGIGRLLYNEVLKYAKLNNLKRVEWSVLDWNIPAVAFYKNSGAQVFDDWRVVQMNEKQLMEYVNKL